MATVQTRSVVELEVSPPRVVTAALPVSAGEADDADVLAALPPVVREKPRIVWDYALVVIGLHALSLLAFVPWFFSWAGVVALVIGIYVYGALGINICYHRLLSHRAFKCPVWLERFFVFIALCCMQDAPGRWVAAHRIHHKFADETPDPHSPLISFLWSHVGWLMVDKHGLNKIANYERYARDLLRQPFYLNLERKLVPIAIYLGHWALYFAGGFLAGWLMHRSLQPALQLGASLVVWGAVVRTVAVWHITWTVNSLTHMFGYRNFNTDEESRNNWFVAVITSGEGWHNNHHADPAAANNGRKWWELDPMFWIIWSLEKLGLAWDVVRPIEQRRKAPRAAG